MFIITYMTVLHFNLYNFDNVLSHYDEIRNVTVYTENYISHVLSKQLYIYNVDR